MTVKELIAHLQTLDENAIVVNVTTEYCSDPCDATVDKVVFGEIEALGKYVVLFNDQSFSEDEIDEFLGK